ncbi:unnamed protein product [Rhizoctonia solani]|uniref:Uncharacterized protein n=1 Tax=Rhizoctonia solani TaxID=456999 RepID=A0A8H3HFD2_9AGAM|nr:unnamed protein product [Rhizoctonia solani]CAE6526241.1 unnamed protein product [Rhizoctonia solani]
MSDSQSEYEQQIFGTVANAAGLIAMFGPLTQFVKHASAKYKPDPTKALQRVQKELDSFNVLLEREKNIVTGQEFQDFGKRYMRIQIKIQKETDRINESQGTRTERQESVENIRRISGSIRQVRKDFVSSSANARKLRSTSTIHIEVCDPTPDNTPGRQTSISRRVWEMCSSSKEPSASPTRVEPNILPAGEPSKPASDAPKAAGYYLSFEQADGTERLVHSEELKNDPSIAPELVDVIIRTMEAHRQGASVTSTSSHPAGSTKRESDKGNADGRSVPIYKVNLDRVPEIFDDHGEKNKA